MKERFERFEAALKSLPLVAILRGLTPGEAEQAAEILYESGFRLIEVPLNSPEPFESIALMRKALPKDALVGAGTVLRVEDVGHLAAIGADLVVMPHADTSVIRSAVWNGLVSLPGIATPTEAFAALEAGAAGLKLFPAELVSPAVLKAMRSVLPKTTRIFPVGGITPDNQEEYLKAGADGFGLGSALYSPGMTMNKLQERAKEFVAKWSARASS